MLHFSIQSRTEANYTPLPLCGGSRFRVAAPAETIHTMYLSGKGTTMSFRLTFYFGLIGAVVFHRRLCNSRAKDKIKNEIDSGGAT